MNDKWIFGVLVFFSLMYIFGTFTFNEDIVIFVQMSIVGALIITTSLIVVLFFHLKRIKADRDDSKSYLFLSISMASYAVAEILWGYFDVLGYETYPSIADISYSIYYLTGILFCVSFFWKRQSFILFKTKVIGVLSSVLFFSVYIFLSLENVDMKVFLVGSTEMMLSSILAGSAIITIICISCTPKLRLVWVFFSIGYISNSIADIFYYSGQNRNYFEYTDWVNIVWFISILIFFYGAFIHNYLYRKT